jgi:Fur family transcriptional regulator, peroxide stress response regulator
LTLRGSLNIVPFVSENKFHLETPGLVALLREAKWRVTPQRLAILQSLATGRHLASCQTIWERARSACANLGLVTVYRTLAGLRAAGLVEQVDIGGTAHFGLVDRHHDHIICQRCGTVAPMNACLLGPLEGVRLAGSDFLVTGHRLDVLGLCRTCQGAA